MRLLVGDLGGAGIFWGDESEPKEPVLRETMREIDKRFDPLVGLSARPRLCLSLPPLFAVVLNRAQRRDRILEAILQLRAELAEPVAQLHLDLSRLHVEKNPKELEHLGRRLSGHSQRMGQLLKTDEGASVGQWIRNVGADALAVAVGLVAAVESNDPTIRLAAAAVAGLKVLNAAALGIARLNYDVRPSLADRIHRATRKVRFADHEALLQKHLRPYEIDAIRHPRTPNGLIKQQRVLRRAGPSPG